MNNEFKIEKIQRIDPLCGLMVSSFRDDINNTRAARVFVTKGVGGWDLVVLMTDEGFTCVTQVLSIQLSAKRSEFELVGDFPQHDEIYEFLSEVENDLWGWIGEKE